MAQPIQAVQIYYEHPFGAEREVLREFFSFVGCLVKTTMMPVETMLEKHKSLVNSESERITHLFLTDRPLEGIVLSKNEMWCSFRILKRELTINGKAILHNADQKISAEQFEKTALDVIIRRIWKDEGAETQSLLHINAAFWQFDLFAFLQIKSTFQTLKMGEFMALPMRGHYYLPEAVYLNKMADAFINMAKRCSVGPSSIYAVYVYVNAQRHGKYFNGTLLYHGRQKIITVKCNPDKYYTKSLKMMPNNLDKDEMDYENHIINLLVHEKSESPIDKLMYEDTNFGTPVNDDDILISYLECVIAKYVSYYSHLHENYKFENIGYSDDFQGTKYMEDLFLDALLNIYIYY